MSGDYVHHDLNSGRVSVRRSGERVHSCDEALVKDARPQVSAATYKRSRTAAADGGPKRMVFADIRGETVSESQTPNQLRDALASAGNLGRRITLNPSRRLVDGAPVFHYADTGEAWTGSAFVLVGGGYAYEVTP